MTYSLLLVEDDLTLGETLKTRLEKANFKVFWSTTVTCAKTHLDKNLDLAILDLNLPDGNGFDLAEYIKSSFTTPIIFLTAMNSAEHRLKGYELGAEEFVPKPFHLKELLLRINRVLKNANSEESIVQCDNCVINFDKKTIEHPGQQINYPTQREMEILSLLINNSPKVVSRETIAASLFSNEKPPTFRTIDNSIVKLRQLLLDDERQLIRSVRGVGYQWTA